MGSLAIARVRTKNSLSLLGSRNCDQFGVVDITANFRNFATLIDAQYLGGDVGFYRLLNNLWPLSALIRERNVIRSQFQQIDPIRKDYALFPGTRGGRFFDTLSQRWQRWQRSHNNKKQ